MITTTEVLDLPEGKFSAQVDKYEAKDRVAFEEIYNSWRILSNQLDALGARKVNLPDGLSECGFCYFFNFHVWISNHSTFICGDITFSFIK